MIPCETVGVWPAVCLWQPWASLTMTVDGSGRMVKRFETRGYKPPSTIVGKRVLIHAAKKPFGLDSAQAEVVRSCSFEVWAALGRMVGGDPEWSHGWPLGALVGSAVIGEGLPITNAGHLGAPALPHVLSTSLVLVVREPSGSILWDSTDISDQRPLGDWAPGRWAWPLIDPRPLVEPIPYRGSQGVFYVDESVIGDVL